MFDETPSDLPHVIVIGAGFGGLSAARALGRQRVRVSMIDRRNHHLFQPLLYQIAMAGLSPADIAYPIRSALRKQPHARVLLGEVERVDLEHQRVSLNDGSSLEYDYLILAAGAENNYFGNESWPRHSLPLKSVEEALDIRHRMLLAFEAAERETDPLARARLLTFVVIGGGPTGVEVAGALRELSRFVLARDFRVARPEKTRVVLVERADRLLSGGFDADLAKAAQRQLEELGVEVVLGKSVEDIDDQGVSVGGVRIDSATVLWTAGVRGSSLARTLGVELDRAGRVPVAPDCSIPGNPSVFVIGDLARFESNGEPLPGLAPVALQQGRYVARCIEQRIAGEPMPPFHYRDKGVMATIGRSRAVAQSGSLKLTGFLAWLAWLFIHIWFLMGFRNRVAVFFNWVWAYLTYRPGARLITNQQSSDEISRLMAWSEHKPAPVRRATDGAARAVTSGPGE